MAPPAWLKRLPARIVVVDVETTGLGRDDRVVSLAAVRLPTGLLARRAFEPEHLHLIFDPGRPSHPGAERVHGYSDWTLRHQEPFAAHAEAVAAFIGGADLVVAHNAPFDVGFIDREFERAGLPAVSLPSYCTVRGYRAKRRGARASLDAACGEIGLSRAGQRHGALEDAWLAMHVYLWLHNCPHRADLPAGAGGEPANYRPPPARPDDPPPRRRAARAA